MSVNLTCKTVIGYKIKKEDYADFLPEDIKALNSIEDLELISFDPMSDSDLILGKTLFRFTDDGYPDDQTEFSKSWNITLLSQSASAIFSTITDLPESILKVLSKEIRVCTIVEYS